MAIVNRGWPACFEYDCWVKHKDLNGETNNETVIWMHIYQHIEAQQTCVLSYYMNHYYHQSHGRKFTSGVVDNGWGCETGRVEFQSDWLRSLRRQYTYERHESKPTNQGNLYFRTCYLKKHYHS